MSKRIDLNDIRLLMQVVEHGSYTAAARAIGVPKSTISQRIASLEAAIGTGLLRRTSRSFSLTEAGSQLLPHARAIEELAQQVERAMMQRGRELQGTLRVSCSNALAQFALSRLMPRFLAKHEQVTVRLEASNRLVDLVSESFDMTIRGHVGPLKDSILRQRVVARVNWIMAASPEWLRSHGEPSSPDDLQPGALLYYVAETASSEWALRKGEERRSINVAPRLVSDDMATIRSSAIEAGGIACLPAYILRAAIASGQLTPVLDDWTAQVSMISVLTPPKAQSSRLAGAFSDFLAAELPRVVES